MEGLDSVAYGPDGQLVVSGQWDGQVRVHDPVTGMELRRIDVGPSHSAWVAFSHDGRRMVCAVGYAIREFPLVDFESGKILKTFEGQGHGSRLAVFSPDGRQILTSHAGLWNYNKSEVVCWDAASGERIQQFCLGTDEPVYCARFSPDGQRILTSHRLWRSDGAHRSSARIWNVADGTLLHTLADPERFLEDAIFSPDGKNVLTSCGEIAVLWDALSGRKLRAFVGHRAKIESIAFSPDGRRVLTGSADRTVGVWETATGSRVGTIPVVVGIVNNVAFSPDGRSAAVGIRRRGAVEVWDLDDVKLGSAGPPIRAFEMRPFQGTREEALAVLRKSNAQIGITADGRIRSMALPQNQTPDEIFACVACFPELEELTINYADVDDFRLQYLAGLSNLKRLVLHDTDISDEGLAILGRLTSLEHLDLSESRLVGWGMAHLNSLDNLTSLDLNRNWWLSGVALEPLDQLKRLERLDLSGNDRIHPAAFRHLARVSSLKSLNVEGTLIDDDAMQAIAKLPRLQTLALSDRTRVTAQGVRNLAGSPVATLSGPDLKEDEIGSLGGLAKLSSFYRLWPAARDSDLPSLVRMKDLADLRVQVTDTPEGAAGGKSLGELHGLETLYIWGDPKSDWTILSHLPRVPRLTQLAFAGVPDEALATMPRLEQLEVLDLSRCNIQRGGLACLGRLPRLRRLLLNPQALNDDDLESLALSKSLEDLCLSGRSASSPDPLPSSEPRTLTERSLEHLAALGMLRQLDLTNLPITDQGLAPLATLRRLEQLRLDETKITDAGLKHLEGMPEMRWLSFSGSTVSREAAERLQRDHMPACHIDDNWCDDGCLALQPLVPSPAKEPQSSQ
jgi:Leucine-rich repeat (LRR) protein